MAASAVFLEKPETQLEDLLERVCRKLQLTPTQHHAAEGHYHAIGDWLAADGSALKPFDPQIYSQGSVRIGTTNPPIAQQEYDLDLVCQLEVNPLSFPNPAVLLHAVEGRIREHETYRKMVEPKPRCVRVTYATQFHLDIIPACPDRYSGGTCVVIPDRDAKQWRASNPRGFAAWFLQKCEIVRLTFLEKAEPVPALEASDEKAPLKLAVQLLKRARDIGFRDDPGSAPSSIVLTTLAALNYQGEETVASALSGILQRIVNSLPVSGRLWVLNPTNPQEDFSDCWANNALYLRFVKFIAGFNERWQRLLITRGMANLALQLQQLFGEDLAKAVVREQTEFVTKMRDQGQLGIRRSAAVLSGMPSGAISVPRNTFYGGKK